MFAVVNVSIVDIVLVVVIDITVTAVDICRRYIIVADIVYSVFSSLLDRRGALGQRA